MRKRSKSRGPVLVESLENRQLMSAATLNTNLIVDGDFEAENGATNSASTVLPTAWSTGIPDAFTVVAYGATGGLPDVNTPGPTNRGSNFFAGGPNTSHSITTQFIDISALANGIDAGVIKANLSGWFGGWGAEDDHIEMTMTFVNSAHDPIGSDVVMPSVFASDRNNITSLIKKSLTIATPPKTRGIAIELDSIRSSGSHNDGYADNLSLVFSSTSKTGFVSARVFNDVNGDGMRGAGENAMKRTTVFVDKNNNLKLDAGEISAKSNNSGNCTLANIPVGRVYIREVAPVGYRTSSPNTYIETISGGATSTGVEFGNSQSARISGSVFNDTNANGSLNAKEPGVDGVTVFLDFNDNGQLDPFELRTTSSGPSGLYVFNVPFGTYVVRMQAFAGFKQTGSLAGHRITVAKAQTASGGNFGLKRSGAF